MAQPALTRLARTIGCLRGIATGDAIGKQTEGRTTAEIAHWYPAGISGFHCPASSVLPRSFMATATLAIFSSTTTPSRP